MNTKIYYADIEDNAAFDVPTVTASETFYDFCDTDMLRSWSDMTKYATVELNRWRLDGTFKTAGENSDMPYWSRQVSPDTAADSRYSFSKAITITFEFETSYPMRGVTLISNDDAYAAYVNITTYQDGTQKLKKSYYPNSGNFYCELDGNSVNRVVFTFYAMSKANRYLRLDNIVFGAVYTLEEREIGSVNIINEISMKCTELPANAAEAEILTTQNIPFDAYDQFVVYSDSGLEGIFYIVDSQKTGNFTYSVTAYNFVYLLEAYRADTKNPVNVSFKDLLYDYILVGSTAQVTAPDKIMTDVAPWYFYNDDVSGRNALLGLINAAGVVYTVNNSNVITLAEDFSADVKTIPEADIFDDISSTTSTEKANIVLRRQSVTTSGQDFVGANSGYSIFQKVEWTADDIGKTKNITFAETMFVPSVGITRQEPGTAGWLTGYTNYWKIVSASAHEVVVRLDSVNPGHNAPSLTERPQPWVMYVVARPATYQIEEFEIYSYQSTLPRLYTSTMYIDSNRFSDAGDERQIQRAKKYYADETVVSATIVMPDGLKCGDRVKLDTDKYDHFTGVVERMEYTLLGGQKRIGKVQVRKYG